MGLSMLPMFWYKQATVSTYEGNRPRCSPFGPHFLTPCPLCLTYHSREKERERERERELQKNKGRGVWLQKNKGRNRGKFAVSHIL